MRNRRPIFMKGIFLSQSKPRTVHVVEDNARAASGMLSKSGSTMGGTTEGFFDCTDVSLLGYRPRTD